MVQTIFETHQNRNAELGVGDTDIQPAVDSEDTDWLALHRASFEASTTYRNSELARQWERNLRSFNNQHPRGSKYDSADYRHRSRLFRPKTRASVRKGEAQAAAAFFATEDVARIAPTDGNDERNRASADFYQEVLNYRLDGANAETGIRWFMTLMGAYQTSQVMGVVASMQYWEYKERQTGTRKAMVQNEETGAYEVRDEPIIEVMRDRPVCELLPPENVRIDRGSDWMDPVNSSPYLIIMRPMYVGDIKTRMKEKDNKTGQSVWRKVDDAVLIKAKTDQHDPTREARESNNQRDPKDSSDNTIRDHDIVWVHEVFQRSGGEDYQFYTVGIHALLSDPKPTGEVYRHCRDTRPVVMGYGVLEAFRNYPAGKPELLQGLQQGANDLANLRIDNVHMAMTGRVKVRSGRDIDLENVRRYIPGGVISLRAMDDLEYDRPPDVTFSAYAEQDRINVDMDELAGTFSSSSVQTSRQLNETVGGMKIMSSDANQMGDYDLRVFAETWVEPVLRQLVSLEQRYETDLVVMALAAQKAGLVKKYGISSIDDEFLDAKITVKVNVGVGATDPTRRLERFLVAQDRAVTLVANVLGPEQASQMIDVEQQVNEIFGLSGYKDGGRFFRFDDEEQDPQIQMLQQQLQQLQAELQGREAEFRNKIEVVKTQGEYDLAEQSLQNEGALEKERLDNQGDLERERMRMLSGFLTQGMQTAGNG